MTPDTKALSELVERVEKAEGADRGLDAAIMRAFYVRDLRCVGGKYEGTGHPFLEPAWVDPTTDKWVTTARSGFEFTASLDAALALVERVLPGAMWQVGFDPDDGSICARLVTVPPPCSHAKANHDTAPLALLAATLKALIAKASLDD